MSKRYENKIDILMFHGNQLMAFAPQISTHQLSIRVKALVKSQHF